MVKRPWLRTTVTLATVAAMLVFSACSSDESSTDDGSSTTAPGARTGGVGTTSTVDPDTPQVATPVVAGVPAAPIPFAGSDDRTHAVYELFLTNVAREPATITEIDVLDADSGTNVATLDAARLDDVFVLANSSPAGGTLGPAQSGIVYLHLVFDGPADVPGTLTHDIAVSYPTMGSLDDVTLLDGVTDLEPQAAVLHVDENAVATVTVDDREVPVLGPPLKGHVHLIDSPLPVASNGVPYTIDSFTVSGVSVSTEAFDRAEADGTPLEYAAVEPPKTHAAQYPMDQSIMTF